MDSLEVVLLSGLRRVSMSTDYSGPQVGEIKVPRYLNQGIIHIAYVPIIGNSLPVNTARVQLEKNLALTPNVLLFNLPGKNSESTYLTLGIKYKDMIKPFNRGLTFNSPTSPPSDVLDSPGIDKSAILDSNENYLFDLVKQWIESKTKQFNIEEYRTNLYKL